MTDDIDDFEGTPSVRGSFDITGFDDDDEIAALKIASQVFNVLDTKERQRVARYIMARWGEAK